MLVEPIQGQGKNYRFENPVCRGRDGLHRMIARLRRQLPCSNHDMRARDHEEEPGELEGDREGVDSDGEGLPDGRPHYSEYGPRPNRV